MRERAAPRHQRTNLDGGYGSNLNGRRSRALDEDNVDRHRKALHVVVERELDLPPKPPQPHKEQTGELDEPG